MDFASIVDRFVIIMNISIVGMLVVINQSGFYELITGIDSKNSDYFILICANLAQIFCASFNLFVTHGTLKDRLRSVSFTIRLCQIR